MKTNILIILAFFGLTNLTLFLDDGHIVGGIFFMLVTCAFLYSLYKS